MSKNRSERLEDVQREAGLQHAGKWVCWIQNNQFNAEGAIDGIFDNPEVYGGKAHCVTNESDFNPDGWNKVTGNPLKEGATFICREPVPRGIGEDIYDWFDATQYAPRGYCKHCVKALKKRQQKSR